jgi:hypothetical protein
VARTFFVLLADLALLEPFLVLEALPTLKAFTCFESLAFLEALPPLTPLEAFVFFESLVVLDPLEPFAPFTEPFVGLVALLRLGPFPLDLMTWVCFLWFLERFLERDGLLNFPIFDSLVPFGLIFIMDVYI